MQCVLLLLFGTSCCFLKLCLSEVLDGNGRLQTVDSWLNLISAAIVEPTAYETGARVLHWVLLPIGTPLGAAGVSSRTSYLRVGDLPTKSVRDMGSSI